MQPIRKNLKKINNYAKIPKKKNPNKKDRKHKEYGTSKLEERFAKDFLEKLGVEYVYQFKAESIGRYFDFYLPQEHILVEVDGDYYHSFGLVYEEMSPMQKRNKRVDEQKDHWALINGIPLIRIWEHDINNHPEKILKMLKNKFSTAKENKIQKDKRKLRHFGKENNE